MEQFSLEKYLENPQCKVVTRRGNPVRIICTDRKHGEDDLPIVFLEECLNGEFLLSCRKDGRSDTTYDTPHDLFFADKKEELTEFEKEVKDLMNSCCNEIGEANITNEWAKEKASNLLDLARKEVLQDLPKVYLSCGFYDKPTLIGKYLHIDGYFINISKLFEKLPKAMEE